MTPAAADPGSLGSARSALRPPTSLTCIVVLYALLAAGIILRETRNYYFFSDDFLNFIIIRDMSVKFSYFMRDFTGEFVPLCRVANLVYFTLFGLSFWPFRIGLVLYQWTLIAVMARFGFRKGVPVEILIPATALLACSPIYGTPYQWWSAALNVLAGGLASLLAIILTANSEPATRRRQVLTALCYATGLLLYPKGLVVAPILFAMRIFVGLEGGLRFFPAVLRAAREVWAIAAVGAVYIGIVISGHYSPGVQHPDTMTVLRYIWRGWNAGFLSGILGFDRPFALRAVLLNAVIVGIVMFSVIRRPRTLILWLAFFFYVVVALAVIAENRAVPFGLESASTARYYTDMLGYFIAVLFTAWAQTGRIGRTGTGTWRIALVMALTVLGSVHLLRAEARVPYLWIVPPKNIEAFVGNVRQSLSGLGADARIADTTVPEWVMPQWIFPLTRYQYFLTLFHWRGKVVPASEATVMFTSQGRLVPAHPDSARPPG